MYKCMHACMHACVCVYLRQQRQRQRQRRRQTVGNYLGRLLLTETRLTFEPVLLVVGSHVNPLVHDAVGDWGGLQ